MTSRHRRALVAATTVLLVASARDSLAQDRALMGVRAVDVVVESLPPAAAAISLTRNDIRTKVELRLRMAGLRVVPSSEQWLYVRVGVIALTGRSVEGLYTYDVLVALREMLELPRTKTLVEGELWQTSGYGSVGSGHAREVVLEDINDSVDGFLNAWLAANPKSDDSALEMTPRAPKLPPPRIAPPQQR